MSHDTRESDQLTELEKTLYRAIKHTLNRAQICPDFRHYMLGTETMELCCKGEAAVLDEQFDEVLLRRSKDRQPPHRARQADVTTLRKRVDELEAELREAKQ